MIFTVLSLSLFTVLLLIQIRENQPEWKSYQKAYFMEQVRQRESELSQTTEPDKILKLQQEINDWKNKTPEVVNLTLPNGKTERCQSCHLGIEEISSSHPADTFGCTVCHGGNGLALDKDTAHANWWGEGNPGSLQTVNYSCGGTGFEGTKCHSGNPNSKDNFVNLVPTSLMVTKAGELSTIRRTFNIQPWKDIPEISKGNTAASIPNPLNGYPKEALFQMNCLSQCHQANGTLPDYRSLFDLPITSQDASQNGSDSTSKLQMNTPSAHGCQSCHVLMNPTHTYQGQDVTIDHNKPGYGKTHQLTTEIPYTQCNQCHNQGKHDSINMTFTPRNDLSEVVHAWEKGEETWEERYKNYYLPGEIFTQCEVSLDCIDCHTRQDVMGDGKIYTSQNDAVHIQCQDCHGTIANPPRTRTVTSREDSVLQGKFTNSYFPELNVGDSFVLSSKGEDLPFIRPVNGQWILRSKVTGKEFTVPLAYGTKCEQDLTKQRADDCHKCHNQ